MVPEKGKVRAKQASLLDAPEDKPDSTDSLVAKAFDSDPKVRLKVAQELAKIDDPRAVFALIELSSDKEEAVKVAAQKSLGSFKEEAETIVSLEKMLAERSAFHTGQSLEQIEKDSDRDRWFTAQQALNYGFIDAVIEHAQTPQGA